MVMLSQARVVVVGQGTSWLGCGGIRSTTAIKSEPAYAPKSERLGA